MVPGALLLDEALAALAARRGLPYEALEVRHAKFVQPVRPDQGVEVSWEDVGAGSLDVRLQGAGGPVAAFSVGTRGPLMSERADPRLGAVQARVSRAQIGPLLPHGDRMCLLAAVRAWYAEGIEGLAVSHRDPTNPLRARDRLGAACAIEYAAQAMAVHGALCASGPSQPGGALLAARDIRFFVARLDDIEEPLVIDCRALAQDARGAMYRFQVGTATRLLVSGRATVQFVALAGLGHAGQA